MTEQHQGSETSEQTLLKQMGGLSGLVTSTLPVLVFVPVNAQWGLQSAIIGALIVAAGILIWRLVRKDNLMPAFSGFLGVALCAFIAWRMGDAKGFYVYGIWYSLVAGIVFLLSIIIKYPLIGMAWYYVNNKPQTWRTIPEARRPISLATFAWAIVFFARFILQQTLYDTASATTLGIVRMLMGWPLTLLAFLVCFWAVKKSDSIVARESDNNLG